MPQKKIALKSRMFTLALLMTALPHGEASAADHKAVILSVGGYAPRYSTRLLDDFEQAVREEGSSVTIREVETVPTSSIGAAYRFAGAPAGAAREETALESVDGFLFFDPPQPQLLARVKSRAAADHFLPAYYERRAVVGGGEARFQTPRRASAQERATAAVVYDLEIEGNPARAVFLLKVRGGLSRTATALKELRGAGEDALVVSHGDWSSFGLAPPPRGRALYEALDKLGLQAAAVGAGEFSNWTEFLAHRAAHPEGAAFLATNLVGPHALPATRIFEKGGLSIGVLGLTRLAHARYLGHGALKDLTLSDPVEAARAAVAELRPKTDVIVALSNMEGPDNARLEREVPGIDVLIVAGDGDEREEEAARGLEAYEEKRAAFSRLLYTAPDLDGVDRLEVAVGDKDADGLRRMEVRQRHRTLDESVTDAEGWSAAPVTAGTSTTTLIPAAHKIFPDGRRVRSREFWTLAASLLADRTRSEVGLMLVEDAGPPPPGDYKESDVRALLGFDDQPAVFELPGDALDALLREARSQADAERRGPPQPGKLRLAAGGVGEGGTVHGTRVERSLVYKVSGSERLLANASQYPELMRARRVELRGELGDALLGDLRRHAAKGHPAGWYAHLMEGRAVEETPYWTINIRDLSARFSNTKAVRDFDAFASVPNSRVTGFDQQSAGFNFQGDLDYRFRGHKWTNTAEIAYAETRLNPRNAPAVIDRTDNRVMALTAFTEHLSSFPLHWLGESVGPTVSLQYDGEVKRRSPDVKRRNIYAVNPGVEIYDGSIVNSVQLTATLRRDYSVEPPESQYGMRARAVWALNVPVGHGGQGKLQGEVWNNYYFRRSNDQPTDLQLEGDANARLNISLWKDLSLAPFIDCYWFKLKQRPVNGYSLMTGVSLSFSRLWKPQFEKF
jgi:hypothetical protein